MFELPPRNVPFIVVCRSFHTYELLTLKNDWRNTFYVQPPNKNEELWQELKAHGFTESGIPENLPCLPYFPLFSPCRPLESLINDIERNVLKNHSLSDEEKEDANLNSKKFTCCDIGCGSGRDDIWLALRHNTETKVETGKWHVTGVDYNENVLRNFQLLATRTNVINQTNIIHAKIRGDDRICIFAHGKNDRSINPPKITEENKLDFFARKDCPDKIYYNFAGNSLDLVTTAGPTDMVSPRVSGNISMEGQQPITNATNEMRKSIDINSIPKDLKKYCFFAKKYDLVLCVRFLDRNILKKMLLNLVKPGGYFLMYAFMKGAEKYGTPKNPHRLLLPDELKTLFESNGFETIYDQTTRLPDGRPMQAFLAKKAV